ncbi:TetR/AcrR family transcriptional regulator [Clostridium manihotivorum]|uniref:TetR/AcrR family transcriptional regulator n=1 Tax=Clostridium manihotivorum TaxID=2320868 RepID=A0A3R5V639_9CLOT|nr:TetR/AcrR family transcriptional regulator [Clostridium manihotivorum]QAA31041.1 TetR/AcrR family transcriptional regulator [Clostridium manihotivorum]
MEFFIKRKERIILTAIEIISELGFQGLATKEISQRQGISDGTLYKHFRNKDEIILGILDYFSKFDDSIRQSIELSNFSAKESIRFFVKMRIEYYENYPAITAVAELHETFKHESEEIKKRNKDIFEDRYKLIMHYIEKGKKNGEFRVEVDSEALTDMILGSSREAILKWRLNDYNFPLKDRVMNTIDMILKYS